MKTRIKIILSLLFITFCKLAYAEGDHYQFELLVFEQGLQSSAVLNQTESKIKWPTALTELTSFQQTDNKTLKVGAAKLLQASGNRTILHYAWQQSTGPGKAILPMHIVSEDGRLDGFIHLRNVQPLELNVDLELMAINTKDPTARPYRFHLNERRPIKLNATQYFDHPKIGVVIQVSGG